MSDRPRSSLLVLMLVLSPFAVIADEKERKCPLYDLGVTTSKDSEGGVVFNSTVFVRPFSNESTFIDEAKNDSQLFARLQLRKDKNVPKTMNGKVVGIVDSQTCISEGRVYTTVSVSEKSAAKAVEIANKMEESLRSNPTPTQGSYSIIYQ